MMQSVISQNWTRSLCYNSGHPSSYRNERTTFRAASSFLLRMFFQTAVFMSAAQTHTQQQCQSFVFPLISAWLMLSQIFKLLLVVMSINSWGNKDIFCLEHIYTCFCFFTQQKILAKAKKTQKNQSQILVRHANTQNKMT